MEYWIGNIYWELLPLRIMKVKVTQSCPTLCNPLDYTVHGILKARILELVAVPLSRGILPTQGSNQVSLSYLTPITPGCGCICLLNINLIGQSVSSVAQSCPTLCDPMNHSTPGLPIHHQLLEFTQTHVHGVGDAIQPSHPLLSPSPPVPNPSQHQSLFQWVSFLHQVAKVLEFQLQRQSFQWTPRTDIP